MVNGVEEQELIVFTITIHQSLCCNKKTSPAGEVFLKTKFLTVKKTILCTYLITDMVVDYYGWIYFLGDDKAL